MHITDPHCLLMGTTGERSYGSETAVLNRELETVLLLIGFLV